MPRKRKINTASIPTEAIEQVRGKLEDLPEKPKASWTLREAVAQMYEPIQAALQRGYTHDEIATMLGENGVFISPASLKRYLSLSKVEPETPTAKTRRSRTTRSKQQKPESSTAQSVSPETTTADPEAGSSDADDTTSTSTKPRRSRKRTTATSTSSGKSRTAAKTKSTPRTSRQRK